MKVDFKDGKIIAEGQYFEQAKYDIGSEKIGVVADGCGGLLSYRVANRAEEYIPTFLSLDLSVGGERLSPYLPKRVEMIGRMQRVLLETSRGVLTLTTFLSPRENGVFYRVEGDFPFDLSLNYRGDRAASAEKVTFLQGESMMLSSSVAGDYVAENDAFYLSAEGRADLLLSFASTEREHRAAYDRFDECLSETLSEISEVVLPDSVRSEEEKALYFSAYFTALENFKRVGDFAAFAAGVRYTDPLRTYFRDSYFTVLPLLYARPDLVREEILTLARGISEDGTCPSAVKSDFTAFWGGHYDSPSFFVMEVYDYVTAAEDESILSCEVNGRTLGDVVKSVVMRLIGMADERGLIYKEGEYNKRDWADEVNRSGYVTFVEALYYRALICASRLFTEPGDVFPMRCTLAASLVKFQINELLFDEKKGYYVNYRTKDYVEDNLSIDTLFTVIFGIADEGRAERVLDSMERLLETRNNAEQGGGDFGVMCVYPPYALPKEACHKSARLYDYHNGANWCYLTAMYAYAKSLYRRDWRTPLLTTFRYYTERGHYTPVEYFSPCCPMGSALQGWSAAMAFAFAAAGKDFDE